MSETTLAERRETRLAEAFRLEELAGLKLAARARLVALVVVAVWLFFWTSPPETAYLEVILVVFAAIGIAHYRVRRARWDRPWFSYLFVALDFALLAFATLGLSLVLEGLPPPQMELRKGTIVYFFIFLSFVAVSYSPGLMLWAGLCGAAAWGAGVLWILSLPETVTHAGHSDLPPAERVAQHLDPHFVDFPVRQQEIVVLLLLAGVLAVVVWRGKRLVERQAAAERERANSVSLFLAQHGRPAGPARLAAGSPYQPAGGGALRRHDRLHPGLRVPGAGEGHRLLAGSSTAAWPRLSSTTRARSTSISAIRSWRPSARR